MLPEWNEKCYNDDSTDSTKEADSGGALPKLAHLWTEKKVTFLWSDTPLLIE